MLHVFKEVSDSELVSRTKKIAIEERKLLKQMLAHLEEIERRRLHLILGFSSLFDFCLREIGYSRDEAGLRIGAMRLVREVPDVLDAVEEGRLCLTNLAMAQTYFRQSETPLPVEEKRDLLKSLEGLSTRECKKKLTPPQAVMRRSFEVDDEILADLTRIRELWGNQDLSEKEMLRKMAKLVLSRIDPELKQSVGAHRVKAEGKTGVRAQAKDAVTAEPGAEVKCEVKMDADLDADWANTLPPEMVTPENRHIPAHVKLEVWKRDQGRCTYQHPKRRCESRYALQFDHLDDYGCGGAHTIDNLRLLCRAHHRLKSRGLKSSGLKPQGIGSQDLSSPLNSASVSGGILRAQTGSVAA